MAPLGLERRTGVGGALEHEFLFSFVAISCHLLEEVMLVRATKREGGEGEFPLLCFILLFL